MKLAPALTNPIPECPHRSCILLKTKTCINYLTQQAYAVPQHPPAKNVHCCFNYAPPILLPFHKRLHISFPPPRERSNGPMHEHASRSYSPKSLTPPPPSLIEGPLVPMVPASFLSLFHSPPSSRTAQSASLVDSSLVTGSKRACRSLEPLTSLPSSASTSFAYHWSRHQRFDRADARHSISPIALIPCFQLCCRSLKPLSILLSPKSLPLTSCKTA